MNRLGLLYSGSTNFRETPNTMCIASHCLSVHNALAYYMAFGEKTNVMLSATKEPEL